MIYVQLYKDERGRRVNGPVIGPVVSVYWNRGFLMLTWPAEKYMLPMNDNLTAVQYCGEEYIGYEIMTYEQVWSSVSYCNPMLEIHSHDIFKKLIEKI